MWSVFIFPLTPCRPSPIRLQTTFFSIVLGMVSALYETDVVLAVIFLTTIVTIGLILFTLQSAIRFSAWAPFLFSMLWVLIGFGLLRVLFPYSPIVESVYAAVGALVFAAFICVDTWRLVTYVFCEWVDLSCFSHCSFVQPFTVVFVSLDFFVQVLPLFTR